MAAELPTLLLQFQPESEELRSRQKYDQAARQFVKQLDNVSSSHWLKGAETPQDVLEVGEAVRRIGLGLTERDPQPRSELDSVRLRPPPPHLCGRR